MGCKSSCKIIWGKENRKEMLHSIKDAAKQNIIPGICLFCLLILIVCLYFFVDACDPFFQWLTDLKTKYEYGYAAIATAFFGGIMPFLLGLCTDKKSRDPKLATISFFFLAAQWAIIGIILNLLYKLQVIMFGEELEVWRVVCKVAFDQFVYNPVVGVWLTFFPLHFRNCAFSPKKFRETCTLVLVVSSGIRLYATVLMIWIPCASAMYCLPVNLQLPVQNIVSCFSNLLYLFVSKGEKKEKEEEEPKNDSAAAVELAETTV